MGVNQEWAVRVLKLMEPILRTHALEYPGDVSRAVKWLHVYSYSLMENARARKELHPAASKWKPQRTEEHALHNKDLSVNPSTLATRLSGFHKVTVAPEHTA